MYCESLWEGMGEGKVEEMVKKVEICEGVIMEVGNKGGGKVSRGEKVGGGFRNEKVVVG